MGDGSEGVQTCGCNMNKLVDLMCSIVTVVSIVLYPWKLPRVDFKCSHHTQKLILMWGERYVN